MAADFLLDISRWVEKVKGDPNTACRLIALELHKRIVMRSPVGNPELWAANAEAALQRSQHNAVVDQINANLASDFFGNLTAGGRAKALLGHRIDGRDIKRRVRSASNKRLSRAQLAKAYPLAAGRGYVGGRFRANWQVSVGSPSASTVAHVDPSGAQAIAQAQAALASFTAGPSIFIQNNLPYAVRLEYGWSKQAPAGMVRIAAAEFQSILDAAVRGTTSGEQT